MCRKAVNGNSTVHTFPHRLFEEACWRCFHNGYENRDEGEAEKVSHSERLAETQATKHNVSLTGAFHNTATVSCVHSEVNDAN